MNKKSYYQMLLVLLICSYNSGAKESESILSFRQIDFGFIENPISFGSDSVIETDYRQNLMKSTNLVLLMNNYNVTIGGAYGGSGRYRELSSFAIRLSIGKLSDTLGYEFKSEVSKGYAKFDKDKKNKAVRFPEMIEAINEFEITKMLFGNESLLSLKDTVVANHFFGYLVSMNSGIKNYRFQNGIKSSSLKSIEINEMSEDSIKYYNNTNVNGSIVLSAYLRAIHLFINPNLGLGYAFGISKSSDRNISWFNEGFQGDLSLNMGYKSKQKSIGIIALVNVNIMRMNKNIYVSNGTIGINCYYRYSI